MTWLRIGRRGVPPHPNPLPGYGERGRVAPSSPRSRGEDTGEGRDGDCRARSPERAGAQSVRASAQSVRASAQSVRTLPAIAVLLLLAAGCRQVGAINRFSGQRALGHVEALCEFGPRPVGSEANLEAGDYIARTLEAYGWTVEFQEFGYRGERVRNIIGKRGSGPVVVLGTHYDTRSVTDRDPVDRSGAVLGANDGGSGTAVLLELARVLDRSATDEVEIWLAFFDASDQGELSAWPWCVGAREMANTLAVRPEYVLVIDMVGDADQQFYYEWSSSLWLLEKVWRLAEEKGYGAHFTPEYRHQLEYDHTPFFQWGIPAAVVIDFDYPYWHTQHDTLDKVSADSLQRIGDVLETLLEQEPLPGDAEGNQDTTTQ